MIKRVVVTGIGIVSPVGNNLKSAWQNITNGQSGIGFISKFDTTEYITKIGGEVRDFSTVGFVEEKDSKRHDPFISYGLVAGIQAIRDSGINDHPTLDRERVGIIIGSGIGGLLSVEETSRLIKEKGPKRVSPFFIPNAIGNMVAGNLSIMFGYQGLNYGVASACATGNHCIGDAMRYIQHGDCDVIIAGGSEAPITNCGIAGFNAARAMSTKNEDPTKASRPWDIDRDGFVIGEGSGVLVLEEYEHAISRGAHIYAELIGYAATSDANHITAPLEDGSMAARSMDLAVKSAKIEHSQIDYINAHGTSTPLGDIAETTAIKRSFGNHANNLLISSTKSMTGHLLGAASAIEAIFSIMSLQDGIIPPTINLENQDPKCDLNYVPLQAVQKDINYALSNSFGFGGTNSSIIFKKFKGK